MSDSPGRQADSLLENAIDSAIDGMAILDVDGNYLYLNQAHADLYGYDDREALVGANWRLLYEDDEIERLEATAFPALEETGEWRGEATGTRKGGEQFAQELSLTCTDEERIICVVRDVTDRRERRETLERYETILKNVRDAVYTLDMNGRITWVNEVAVEEFDVGYTREDLVGSSVSKVLEDADINKCLDIIQRLIHEEPGGSGRCQVDIQTAYGDEIPCDLHLALLPATGEDERYRGTVGVLRDISEQKRREQRLSVLHRALRHNLRNDMNALLGQVELLERTVGDDDRLRTIRRNAESAVELGNRARQIEETLKRSVERRTTVEAVGIVRDVCESARESFASGTVSVDAPAECRVTANETLYAVVENLVENALEHAGDDPIVQISVEDAEADEWARIRVTDDGPGIPRQEIDPLLADEETQLHHASGLGLWFVYWLVDSYGGRLSFEGNGDDGGVVAVELQAASG